LHGWLAPPPNLHHGELDWMHVASVRLATRLSRASTIIAAPKKPKRTAKPTQKQNKYLQLKDCRKY